MHCAWRLCACIMTMQWLNIIIQPRHLSYCHGTTISLTCQAMLRSMYINIYHICARGKASRHTPHGELALSPVSTGLWKGISCDYIVDLPVSHGYDIILVFIDRFMKMSHFILCMKIAIASDFARMFVRLCGLLDSIISDRGVIFTSKFWKALSTTMDIKQKLSTTFHPHTDGQMERMNQTMEQYLRMYCNYQQDDWVELLSLAEFFYNNVFQQTIKYSPFYATMIIIHTL